MCDERQHIKRMLRSTEFPIWSLPISHWGFQTWSQVTNVLVSQLPYSSSFPFLFIRLAVVKADADITLIKKSCTWHGGFGIKLPKNSIWNRLGRQSKYHDWHKSDILTATHGTGSVNQSVTSALSWLPPHELWIQVPVLFSLQLGFGVKANPFMDSRCVGLHIHWSHLQKNVFVFLSSLNRKQHLNDRRWTQKIVFGSCTFSVHFCLQLIVPVLILDWSEALIIGKSKSYSDISSILSSILVGVLRIILTAYSAITLKTWFVPLLRYHNWLLHFTSYQHPQQWALISCPSGHQSGLSAAPAHQVKWRGGFHQGPGK